DDVIDDPQAEAVVARIVRQLNRQDLLRQVFVAGRHRRIHAAFDRVAHSAGRTVHRSAGSTLAGTIAGVVDRADARVKVARGTGSHVRRQHAGTRVARAGRTSVWIGARRRVVRMLARAGTVADVVRTDVIVGRAEGSRIIECTGRRTAVAIGYAAVIAVLAEVDLVVSAARAALRGRIGGASNIGSGNDDELDVGPRRRERFVAGRDVSIKKVHWARKAVAETQVKLSGCLVDRPRDRSAIGGPADRAVGLREIEPEAARGDQPFVGHVVRGLSTRCETGCYDDRGRDLGETSESHAGDYHPGPPQVNARAGLRRYLFPGTTPEAAPSSSQRFSSGVSVRRAAAS